MFRFDASLIGSFVLGCCLLGIGVSEADAQSRRGKQAPAYEQPAPSQGRRGASPARSPRSSSPVGTDLPSASQPANPPSSYGEPSDGAISSAGQMQANDAPDTPGDPAQAPLGGTEWLLAAGAGYALNRLRKENDDDSGEKP